MRSDQSLPFNVFCDIFDEFQKQSKGRAMVSKATEEFSAAVLDGLSPAELMAWVQHWMEEFSKNPEFHFYRGNFFWRVFVSGNIICAELVKKGTSGISPIGKVLTWPATIADPAKLVKNLLDIMRGYENKHAREKKARAQANSVSS